MDGRLFASVEFAVEKLARFGASGTTGNSRLFFLPYDFGGWYAVWHGL